MQVAEDALPPEQPDGDVSAVRSEPRRPLHRATKLIVELQVSECGARVYLG